MKAALYIRVSTKEQIENYSIPVQKERLEAFCKSKGWDVYDFYIDGGYSGSNTDRPELQRMLTDIKNIDVVIVYKLDRLSRSQRDTMELIEDKFLKNEVEFVSITETLDTSTPFGRAMIGILSVFAQLERENIAERMRNGLIKRAQDGYRVAGGDYEPAGYKTNENGDLVVIEEEKEHIQEAFKLYEQYHSITKVQRELKVLGYPVWRFRRYRDILSNKLYIGYVSFAGEYYKGRHDPIITEEQFNHVQELLKRHKGRNAFKSKQSLLSGLMTCSCCGENYLTYTTKDRRNGKVYTYRYYICRARRFPSEYPEKCMNKTWNSKNLEQVIMDELRYLTVTKEKEKAEKPKVNYAAQLSKVNEKLERILNLYAEGNIDKNILDKQIDALNSEKEMIITKRKEESSADTPLSTEDINDLVINLSKLDFNTKQATIQKLINQIFINGEDIKIEWAF